MSRTPRRLLVGTHNPGKLREFRRILGDLEIEIVGAGALSLPEVVEDAESFEKNATKKARSLAIASGLLTLADDSGLEVDALGGAPGVRSARYSNGGGAAENIAKLLSAMAEVPDPLRTARFRCVLALVDPAAPETPIALASGTCEGSIARAPRGSAGFGYDPVFVLAGDPHGRTMAELDDAEKDAHSHRGAACRAIRAPLAAHLHAGRDKRRTIG